MRTVGIIAEYNPFHNGHLHHLNAARAITGSDHIVVVMSGQFVQRGEPALCDKWTRTRMALDNGADLVIELPVYYATAGAAYFARGAVTLLHRAGIVDCLCFGSEQNDIDMLMAAGRLLAHEPPAFKAALRQHLQTGLSYPAARDCAVSALTHLPEKLLTQPNNILGIEYCKALTTLQSPITPYTVARETGAHHGETLGPMTSAKAIRHAVWQETPEAYAQAMPASAYTLLAALHARQALAKLDAYSDIFQYRLQTMPAEKLRGILDMTEGLENRFLHYAAHYRLISELVGAVKSKRYAYTRIQRVVLHTVLDIGTEAMHAFEAAGGPQYIRVLGFRREKAFLLRRLKQNATLPMVVNSKDACLPPLGAQMLEKEITASALYALACPKMLPRHEYRVPLVIR